MNILNFNVYGLEESIKASGYPKSIDIDNVMPSIERAQKLAACRPGSGHDCFLKGIVVQADITAPSYWWPQFQRYHFADIISSQSKMHCLSVFDVRKMCNEYVDERFFGILEEFVRAYELEKTTENFLRMVSNVPMGMELTARITTNYLQLKTIHVQRRGHKLPEWKIFCSWVMNLPKASFFFKV